MRLKRFERILKFFADSEGDYTCNRTELMVQLREEIIDARVYMREGRLYVDEGDQVLSAEQWIPKRVARLPLLARHIISYVKPPPHFVNPSVHLLDRPSSQPLDQPIRKQNAVKCLTETLNKGKEIPDATSVMYLTSAAGEGKTSLIEYLAVQQARRYASGQSDWLLVPIPLGGRTFLRFDDVVVSSLVNRLRFQMLYYDAFLELVRLGFLVPAFDGFEEMIIESSSGEAISALGRFVQSLQSNGSILVSARHSYFKYPSFGSQARLFDSIGSDKNVDFIRFSLDLWSRDIFLRYAEKRGVGEPTKLYNSVSKRLKKDHPVLTRAVLATRLVDTALDSETLQEFLERLGNTPHDYFHEFVGGIVEREAYSKWLDKTGESSGAILTPEEHHHLLASLALEMWLSSTDCLRLDVVSILIEFYLEDNDISSKYRRDIEERIKDHALLKAGIQPKSLMFSHQEFQEFYFGLALEELLRKFDPDDVRMALDRSSLPESSVSEFIRKFSREDRSHRVLINHLQELADRETIDSFVRENCGLIAITLADDDTSGGFEIKNMMFPANTLRAKTLTNVTIADSYFRATNLNQSKLTKCVFINCEFERIEIDGSERICKSTINSECKLHGLVRYHGQDQSEYFAPDEILRTLLQSGFSVEEPPSDPQLRDNRPIRPSPNLRVLESFLRCFLRSTVVNENTIRTKLRKSAPRFRDHVLPSLIENQVLKEIKPKANNRPLQYRLAVTMTAIDTALRNAHGEFSNFVREFQ